MAPSGPEPAPTAADDPADDPALVAVLTSARDRRLLGSGPIDGHIHHAAVFVGAAGGVPTTLLDLGSGAGVPGLVLARAWPTTQIVLLDSAARRGDFLEEAVAALGMSDHVRVVVARAENAGRDPSLREAFAVVTSRSFGPPAVTAECGVAFLAAAGLLLVSEPPAAPPDRWPPDGLAKLGLVDAGVTATARAHVRQLRRHGTLDQSIPRRDGIPAKRPLF